MTRTRRIQKRYRRLQQLHNGADCNHHHHPIGDDDQDCHGRNTPRRRLPCSSCQHDTTTTTTKLSTSLLEYRRQRRQPMRIWDFITLLRFLLLFTCVPSFRWCTIAFVPGDSSTMTHMVASTYCYNNDNDHRYHYSHRHCQPQRTRRRRTHSLLLFFATTKKDPPDDTNDVTAIRRISTSSSSSSTPEEDTTTTINTTERGIRLNKVFTKLYSRRFTEALIREGRIQVNDDIVTDLGRRVVPYRDIVRLDHQVYPNWEEHINNVSSDAAATTKPEPQLSSSSLVNNDTKNDGTVLATFETDGCDMDHDPPQHSLPHVYIKYWKPVGVISTTDRNVPNNLLDAMYRGMTPISTTTNTPQPPPPPYTNRPNDKNVLALQNGRRIFNVGRLDKDSSGLLLLTSDGRVPNTVLSKQFVHTKVYYVVLDKPITYEHIQQLRQGIVITTDTIRQRKHVPYTAPTLPCLVEPLYHRNRKQPRDSITEFGNDRHESSSSVSYIPTAELQITLIEGRNRQIRVMLQSVGSYQVQQLHRIQFMSTIDLTNLHYPGDWTYLNTTEVASLQQAIASTSISSRTTTTTSNHTLIRR
jgi:pseudouridine synthase